MIWSCLQAADMLEMEEQAETGAVKLLTYINIHIHNNTFPIQ